MDRSNRFCLILAVLACSLDYAFPIFFGLRVESFSPNWLILPPILLYLFVAGRADLAGFAKSNKLIVTFFAFTLTSYLVNNADAQLGGGDGGTALQSFNSLVVFFIFSHLVRDEADVRRFLDYVLMASLLSTCVLLMIALGYVGPEIKESWIGTETAARMGIGDPNITFCYLCIGCSFWVTLVPRRIAEGKTRALLALGGVVGALLPAVLGLSRGASIVFLACTFAAGILVVWNFSTGKALKILVLAISGAVLVLSQTNSERLDLLWERWAGSGNSLTTETSAVVRLNSAEWLLDQCLSGPDLLGKGYIQYARDTGWPGYAHLSIADFYIYGGLISALALIAFLIRNGLLLMGNSHCERDPDMRSYKVVLLLYIAALVMMSCTVSVPWVKLIWAAFAVLARSNAIAEQSPRTGVHT